MTKDGVREKVARDLRRLYGGVLDERIPEDMLETLAKLK
jgi:hypothetical protein